MRVCCRTESITNSIWEILDEFLNLTMELQARDIYIPLEDLTLHIRFTSDAR